MKAKDMKILHQSNDINKLNRNEFDIFYSNLSKNLKAQSSATNKKLGTKVDQKQSKGTQIKDIKDSKQCHYNQIQIRGEIRNLYNTFSKKKEGQSKLSAYQYASPPKSTFSNTSNGFFEKPSTKLKNNKNLKNFHPTKELKINLNLEEFTYDKNSKKNSNVSNTIGNNTARKDLKSAFNALSTKNGKPFSQDFSNVNEKTIDKINAVKKLLYKNSNTNCNPCNTSINASTTLKSSNTKNTKGGKKAGINLSEDDDEEVEIFKNEMNCITEGNKKNYNNDNINMEAGYKTGNNFRKINLNNGYKKSMDARDMMLCGKEEKFENNRKLNYVKRLEIFMDLRKVGASKDTDIRNKRGRECETEYGSFNYSNNTLESTFNTNKNKTTFNFNKVKNGNSTNSNAN